MAFKSRGADPPTAGATGEPPSRSRAVVDTVAVVSVVSVVAAVRQGMTVGRGPVG